ncbi:MAG TPA: hypothetical protein PLZ84_09105, partial [Clostridia bacterium]|nr:hypothetical protein [Clostridia bacterium]
MKTKVIVVLLLAVLLSVEANRPEQITENVVNKTCAPVPATATAKPVLIPAEFVPYDINYFALPSDAKEYLGQYVADYKGFVDAVILYKPEFTFESEESYCKVMESFQS